MTQRRLAITTAALIVLFPLMASAQESRTVTLRDAEGKDVTTLTLSDAGNGILVTGTLSGVAPGPHAIHFHETGRCEPPFESAGAHFNPTGRQHGILNAEGHHAGDMPDVFMPEEGQGTIQIFATDVTLVAGLEGSLLDEDGTAIVIHAGPDDHHTDPSGDSGGRIACGVVR